MKIKGITIWEQHVERIVLGVAALVFIGFTATQFIGEPNAAEVGTDTYSPGNVDERLEKQAEELLARLSPNAPAPVEVPVPETVYGTYREKLASGVSPDETLPATLHLAYNISGATPLGPALQPYVVPQLPKPHTLVHRQYFDALVEDVVTGFPELKERFPAEPYDLTWSTPAAVFDLSQVNAQLKAKGSNGELMIPEKWYNNKLPILNVRVEREEQVHDGWTNHVTLAPIPGQVSIDRMISGSIDGSARKDLLELLSDPAVQSDIVQPEFYVTRNASWAPPDPFEQEIVIDDILDEDARRAMNLQRKLSQMQRRRDVIWQQLKELGGPLEEMPDKPPPGRPPRGGDNGLMGGGGSGGGINDPTEQANEANKQKRVRLTKTVSRLDSQIERLQAELATLVDVPAAAAGGDSAPGLLEGDQLLVWAHDMTIEPGKVYRYRFTVEMFNPLFAKSLNLVDEQQHLAKQLRLSSPPSEWSKPMKAAGMLRVFVTRAESADQPRRIGGLGGRDMGSGTAEVYRFHNGRWWSQSFSIAPGDRVGRVMDSGPPRGAKTEIDFRTDWFVLDVFRNVAADNGDLAGRDRSGLIVLQSLSTGEWIERDPRLEALDPERARLEADVDLANLSAQEVASR